MNSSLQYLLRKNLGSLISSSMIGSSEVLDNIDIEPGVIREYILELNVRKTIGPD